MGRRDNQTTAWRARSMAVFAQKRCALKFLLVALGLQGAMWGAGVPPELGSDRAQAQTLSPEESAPVYPPDAPPPRRPLLPDRRQEIEEQTIGADYRVSALQPDTNNGLWVGSWQGLAKIHASTGRIISRVSLPNTVVGALAQDKSGRIWVGTYTGLVRIDSKTGAITAQNFALPSNRVLSLLVDQRGYLWVGTDAGLAMISPDQGLIMTTVKNLPGVSANAMALDPVGNLWVGTLDGLVQVDTASALVKRHVTNLPGVAVQSLDVSPWGKLWIGTSVGLLEADLGIQRVIKTIKEPIPQTTQTPAPKRAPGAKPQKPVQKFRIRREVVYQPGAPDQFELRVVSQLKGRDVTALHFDQVNSIWVGTTTGLLRVNPFNGATGGEIPNLPSGRILSLSPDTGGKLWVGTSEGLGWVNTTTFKGYPHNTFQSVGQ